MSASSLTAERHGMYLIGGAVGLGAIAYMLLQQYNMQQRRQTALKHPEQNGGHAQAAAIEENKADERNFVAKMKQNVSRIEICCCRMEPSYLQQPNRDVE